MRNRSRNMGEYESCGFEPQNRFWSDETKAEHQIWALDKKREGA